VRGTHVPEHLRLPIAGVTPPPTEKDGQRLFPTGNFRFFRPVYRDKTPPCNHACPTGEQIQKYLDYVKHDRYLDGYLTILQDNPMPSVTGRVCYHPCETACNRAEHDEPIGIRNVERFLGDFGLELAENPIKNDLPPLNGTTIASSASNQNCWCVRTATSATVPIQAMAPTLTSALSSLYFSRPEPICLRVAKYSFFHHSSTK